MTHTVLGSKTYHPCYCRSCGYMYFNDSGNMKPCPNCFSDNVNVAQAIKEWEDE